MHFCVKWHISLLDFHNFWFHDLESVTNNFDARPESDGGNKLGEGGFGVVFKGYINGRNVAVKKLAAVSYAQHLF